MASGRRHMAEGAGPVAGRAQGGSMQLRPLVTPAVHPPYGRYHQGIEAAGVARLVALSGQLGQRADGSVPADVAAQAAVAFANIDALLQAAGLGRASILRLTTYLVEAADRPAYMAVRDRWVAEPAPASTLVIVKALALPAGRVEIEALAAG
jgi:enamine deaminase RidA (YjgF/YER057c/UK114 family)